MNDSSYSVGAPLPESRLYTFIAATSRDFALYFLEGQRLIHDLAVVHPIHGAGFAYFRDVVLSFQPLIALLKRGEQIGVYIDSDNPKFLLKIETAHHGDTRCMLLPENFAEFPESMHGVVRVQKLSPHRAPYESVLQIEGMRLREVVNRVLDESYQVASAMIVSQRCDQSLLLHQLPPLPGRDEYEHSIDAARSRRDEIRNGAEEIFERALSDPDAISSAFAELGFKTLAARPVRFECSCSRQRVLEGLRPVWQSEGERLFDPGQERLEVRCEYCKNSYEVSREDLANSASPLN